MLNHLSMTYLLSNTCTKNYWNRTTTVAIIVGDWVVSFFETQSSVNCQSPSSACVSARSWFSKF